MKQHSLRSHQQNEFNYSTHCLLCEGIAVNDAGEQLFEVYRVSSWNCQKTFEDTCDIREDDWAEKVKSKIIFAKDLPAKDALYHLQCSNNFRNIKNIPGKYIQSSNESIISKKVGRPKAVEKNVRPKDL